MDKPLWKQRRVVWQVIYVLLALLLVLFIFAQVNSNPEEKPSYFEDAKNNPTLSDEQKQILEDIKNGTAQVTVESDTQKNLNHILNRIYYRISFTTDQQDLAKLFDDLKSVWEQMKLHANPLTLDAFVEEIKRPQFDENSDAFKTREEVVKKLEDTFKDRPLAFQEFQNQDLAWFVQFYEQNKATVVDPTKFTNSMTQLLAKLKEPKGPKGRPAEPPELPLWGQVLGIAGALTLAFFGTSIPQFDNVF